MIIMDNNNSVFLRAFEQDDYIVINKWRNDWSIQKSTCGQMRFVSLEMEKKWVLDKMMNNTRDIYLSICINDDSKEMIGYASINNINYVNRTAHGGGIVIGNIKYRDGEIKYEASAMIRAYVFDQLNMNRFTGACLSDNKPSEIMMLASGYKLEGIERQAIYKNGKYYDKMNFSLLREEYYDYLNKGMYSFAEYVKSVKRLLKSNY